MDFALSQHLHVYINQDPHSEPTFNMGLSLCQELSHQLPQHSGTNSPFWDVQQWGSGSIQRQKIRCEVKMPRAFSALTISVPLERQTQHICLPAAQLHHRQPDGVLFYGFYLQSLYSLYYFLKILHYSAGPEMHVSSSYAKLITCLFGCQVQKVFRRKIKGTWLDK